MVLDTDQPDMLVTYQEGEREDMFSSSSIKIELLSITLAAVSNTTIKVIDQLYHIIHLIHYRSTPSTLSSIHVRIRRIPSKPLTTTIQTMRMVWSPSLQPQPPTAISPPPPLYSPLPDLRYQSTSTSLSPPPLFWRLATKSDFISLDSLQGMLMDLRELI